MQQAQQQELEPILDNHTVQNNENEIPPEAMEKLIWIRRFRFMVILSAIARLVFAGVWFDIINFIISAVISGLGIIAGIKRHGTLLAIYGWTSIIQAAAALIFVIYALVVTQLSLAFIISFFVTVAIVAIGGCKAIKMKYKIFEYEQMHGPLPRCLGRACRYASQPTIEENTSQNTQSTPNNTDFVMIPMTQQPTMIQQTPQPVMLNQQPVVYQGMQQPVFQGMQQPVFQGMQQPVFQGMQQQSVFQGMQQQPIFVAQPQQHNQVPVMYAFPPQQNNNMYPQNVVQYIPQPVLPQQNVVTQPNNFGYSN